MLMRTQSYWPISRNGGSVESIGGNIRPLTSPTKTIFHSQLRCFSLPEKTHSIIRTDIEIVSFGGEHRSETIRVHLS